MKSKKTQKNYFVTQPSLPSLEEYECYLREIWETKVLTNRGPLVQRFEKNLANSLRIEEPILMCNATVGLMVVMRSLGLSGEVITTPFTFAATASSIIWSGLRPVFVDVEPGGVNICPIAVENAITPQTTAILAVHCYGIPCNHELLAALAKKHNLKLIYDACHAFGSEVKGSSILELGDASVVSLHATKLINSGEGGIVVSKNKDLREKIRLNINFGIINE